MLTSFLLLAPVFICGSVGAALGYFFRYRLMLRRLLTVAAALGIFLLIELFAGTVSSKYSLRENLLAQLDVLPPFLVLYLSPTMFGSYFVARRYRTWWQ
ncbi:MAG TPA: hypothetical protein VKE30_10685 [Chthoniobacterales bacterium]|nr:hypothetical protein [Chthoniobacterales bacterium]